MIRFEPDSLWDAVLRPIAMAVPDGGVYTEIMAPDARFAWIALLALVGAAFAWRRWRGERPTARLLLVMVAAFAVWLATSGNGRYFMAFLLVAGPLAVAVTQLVPASRFIQLSLALGLVGWQAMTLYQSPPWGTWRWTDWTDPPAFDLAVPPALAAQPAVYATLSSITYSLIAPRFHPGSRWVNLAAAPSRPDAPDHQRLEAVLHSGLPLRVVFPTLSGGQSPGDVHGGFAMAIDGLLAPQGLSLSDPSACQLLASHAVGRVDSRHTAQAARPAGKIDGFWVCPLALGANPEAVRRNRVPARSDQAFAVLERTCPRIFRAGEASSMRIPDGAVRPYPGSDFRLYVMDNGEVWYKYARALNPVRVGSVDEVLRPGFHMDCDHVTGRTGLPWERGL